MSSHSPASVSCNPSTASPPSAPSSAAATAAPTSQPSTSLASTTTTTIPPSSNQPTPTTATATTSAASSAPPPAAAPRVPAAAPIAIQTQTQTCNRTARSPSANATPLDLSPSPSTTSLNASSAYSTSSPTPIESLRRYPTDFSTPIPEECDEETGSESYPNEPVTPVSGRQSREFRFCDTHDIYKHRDSDSNGLAASYPNSNSGIPELSDVPVSPTNKEVPNQSLSLAPTPPPTDALRTSPPPSSPAPVVSAKPNAPVDKSVTTQPRQPTPKIERRPSAPPQRPLSRRSSSFHRTMSAFFKRSSSHVVENGANGTNGGNGATMEFKKPNYDSGTSETTLASANKTTPSTPGHRRFTFRGSVDATGNNTPPSPGSPLEMAGPSKDKTNGTTMPSSSDFFDNNTKKNRASTGFALRQKVNFVSNKNNPRRTRSVERNKKPETDILERQPWAIPPDAGTGMKARRLSLSLPDDFTVDVAELLKEYEYQHKLLGRHGKHLGKGATSKVTLMVRKGSPGELYAVKEFRSKSSSETTDEYQKKIKSEYSIAKSLHHPNIVETIRLCTNHGRWNHVMEYCSEGDLFSLVSKKYLKTEGREADRLCLFKQLCQGINYLHLHGIAHRDIKLENLLITKDSKLKITDFGVSEVFSGIHPGLREAGGQCGIGMGAIRLCKPGICGSLPYIAPEVISKKIEYDPRALDVWSSAIVMIYLIFGGNLWEKAEPGAQLYYNEIASGWGKLDAKRAAKPDEVAKDAYPKSTPFEAVVKPVALRRLLLNMLHPDPTHRITMNDVVTHRWMKTVACCQLESYEDPTKVIDVSKKDCMNGSTGKIYCHNHLPPLAAKNGLPPMPGKPGY
ncbi:Uu.00g108730.m01.CDS01 [Anthostomella pinea]|uniref:Uu.00g108730.m01.CDS01 n=1 Tax=Anthostomella pinea TaxID=933095 RepID=A0AAI8YG44_9PEZI|nr:Uu.00g108730.m01.CDS01 [Anthostomella pinea]